MVTGEVVKRYELQVNGATHRVEAEPNTPLLYLLRDDLHLTGPRFGCGLAQCGACSVLLDGVETRSCVTPISSVKTKAVTTIEGLPGLWKQQKHTIGGGKTTASAAAATGAGSHDQLHPVQQAWIDEQVPQCGYCQSGMMIMAVNLLEQHPNPSDAEIETWFSGNSKTGESPHLCRCGTYMSIKAAVKQAAKEMRK